MKIIKIQKGKNVPLKGEAEKKIEDASFPERAAIKPMDFYGLRARVVSKKGTFVKVGEPILEDKDDPRIKIISPVSGHVAEVCRGEKRKLLEVVIQADAKQEAAQFAKLSPDQISELSREQIVSHLLETGSWVFLRQRPFDHIADPDVQPKSIFIEAIDTNPLALNYDVALEGQDEIFQLGLDIVQRLSSGNMYLCISKNIKSSALLQAGNTTTVIFDGSHPAGNVGTHIHELDPIDKGEAVWYLDAQDVVAIAKSFLTGNFYPERIVAVAGEKAERKIYKKTIRGVSIRTLVGQKSYDETRVISGSVLAGSDVGADGYLGFYDTQACLIPRGGKREFLGWTMPGRNKFSFSRIFLSFLNKNKSAVIDSDAHGSLRSIVFNDIYDKYVALDVMTFFLLRAIFAGEIEEMECLGILECSPEDFTLASFVCPSKTDVCEIIQQGLDLIEKEG